MNKSSSPAKVRAYVAGHVTEQVNLDELQNLLGRRTQLEIIDVMEHPELAAEAGVLAVPCFIRVGDASERRVLGNCRDPKQLLRLLGLEDDSC